MDNELHWGIKSNRLRVYVSLSRPNASFGGQSLFNNENVKMRTLHGPKRENDHSHDTKAVVNFKLK